MLVYTIKGEGKPVVLLHAFPLDGEMWEAQQNKLASKAKVIVPDLPGFGGSSIIPEESTIAGMAVFVARLLDDLGIKEPVFLGGLSMGGYVAFEFLRQFPNRLSGLGLFATRAVPDSEEGKQNRVKSIEAIEKFGMEPFVRKIVKSQTGKSTQEKHPEIVKQAMDIMFENAPDGSIHALKAMKDRRDSSDLLPQIKIPVLVVAGEEDVIISAADMKAMHEKIKGSEFHAVKASGHLVNLEQPEIFDQILRSFLERNHLI